MIEIKAPEGVIDEKGQPVKTIFVKKMTGQDFMQYITLISGEYGAVARHIQMAMTAYNAGGEKIWPKATTILDCPYDIHEDEAWSDAVTKLHPRKDKPDTEEEKKP